MAKCVVILLGTFNAQPYLHEQLASIAGQTHGDWRLLASDDGSTDGTVAEIRAFGEEQPQQVALAKGPGQGFAANFLSLLTQNTATDSYTAYCDQDDIWLPDKLARAVTWLETQAEDSPALYCSRTRLIAQDGSPLGLSPLFSRPPGFANALIQNIAGGNTMVFNAAAQALLREAGPVDVGFHDWWTYQVVTACGGTVRFDPEPTLLYRQHGQNLIGSNRGPMARLRRIGLVLRNVYKSWNDRNVAALGRLSHRMTPANREVFERFCASRGAPFPQRLHYAVSGGLYRQSTLGNADLFAMLSLGKV